jgi:hypothetical protein
MHVIMSRSVCVSVAYAHALCCHEVELTEAFERAVRGATTAVRMDQLAESRLAASRYISMSTMFAHAALLCILR